MQVDDTTAIAPSSKTLALTTAAFLGATFCALTALAALSYHRPPPAEPPQAAGLTTGKNDVTLAPGAPQWEYLHIGVAAPATTGWSGAFPGRFRVDERRAARVGVPLPGRIARVLVELGDPVKAGQPLFSVVSADIAALRAEQQRAALEYAAAQEKHARVASMVGAHALAGKDELEAGAAARESELELKLANAKLAALRVSSGAENEFTVVAPRDGVVVDKHVLSAQQVAPHDALVEIADTSVVWAVAEIFETQAQDIAPGTRVRLTRAELPGFATEVPVDVVSSMVDPSLHTVTARAVVPNPDHALRPNTYVEMRFERRVPPGAVELASSAIVSEGQDKYVYVEHERGHFERRRVRAGSSSGNRIVVESGITVGERVVEEGSALLDNARVLAN